MGREDVGKVDHHRGEVALVALAGGVLAGGGVFALRAGRVVVVVAVVVVMVVVAVAGSLLRAVVMGEDPAGELVSVAEENRGSEEENEKAVLLDPEAHVVKG